MSEQHSLLLHFYNFVEKNADIVMFDLIQHNIGLCVFTFCSVMFKHYMSRDGRFHSQTHTPTDSASFIFTF